MIVKSEVKEIVRIMEDLKVKFYFHAGFGLYLHGFTSELDDCDIRIYHPNIDLVYNHLKRTYPHEVGMRGPITFERGTYDNKCIEIANKTSFDICSRMICDCDIGRFEFPFNPGAFSDVSWLPYCDMNLPVASLENLFLYYLVLRRSCVDSKNDEQRIRDILWSEKFDNQKFENTIPGLPYSDKIQELYCGALNRCGNLRV